MAVVRYGQLVARSETLFNIICKNIKFTRRFQRNLAFVWVIGTCSTVLYNLRIASDSFVCTNPPNPDKIENCHTSFQPVAKPSIPPFHSHSHVCNDWRLRSASSNNTIHHPERVFPLRFQRWHNIGDFWQGETVSLTTHSPLATNFPNSKLTSLS